MTSEGRREEGKKDDLECRYNHKHGGAWGVDRWQQVADGQG